MSKGKFTVLFFVFSLLLVCLIISNASGEMRGYWRFEEDSGSVAYDSSDYDNHGILCEDMDPLNCWVDGKRGGALKFDGIDDYVNCGMDSSLRIVDALTIEMWYGDPQKLDRNSPKIKVEI